MNDYFFGTSFAAPWDTFLAGTKVKSGLKLYLFEKSQGHIEIKE